MCPSSVYLLLSFVFTCFSGGIQCQRLPATPRGHQHRVPHHSSKTRGEPAQLSTTQRLPAASSTTGTTCTLRICSAAPTTGLQRPCLSSTTSPDLRQCHCTARISASRPVRPGRRRHHVDCLALRGLHDQGTHFEHMLSGTFLKDVVNQCLESGAGVSPFSDFGLMRIIARVSVLSCTFLLKGCRKPVLGVWGRGFTIF